MSYSRLSLNVGRAKNAPKTASRAATDRAWSAKELQRIMLSRPVKMTPEVFSSCQKPGKPDFIQKPGEPDFIPKDGQQEYFCPISTYFEQKPSLISAPHI